MILVYQYWYWFHCLIDPLNAAEAQFLSARISFKYNHNVNKDTWTQFQSVHVPAYVMLVCLKNSNFNFLFFSPHFCNFCKNIQIHTYLLAIWPSYVKYTKEILKNTKENED